MMIILLRISFYILMYVLYQFANGKLGKGIEYENWVKNYGKTVRNAVFIIVIIYTLGLIMSLI